ncbi:MAG TPA: helix-turn-helix domain-containing protein [Thermoanaerobaculia bacterium]|nr:helix-turn-helix domain-containing protein [Thermoanaerobaculia bacterium]
MSTRNAKKRGIGSKATAVRLECLALSTLRRTRRLSAVELAERVDLHDKTLSKYETTIPPKGAVLEALLAALGYDREDYAETLELLTRKASRCAALPVPAEPPAAPLAMTPVDPTPEEWREIGQLAAHAGREAEQATLKSLAAALRVKKTAVARAEADVLCERLAAEPKPWLAVESVRELQTWAVAETLAHQSAEAARTHPGRALDLAALSSRVAELAPCGETFRHRLLGYTLTHGENALRAAHRLSEAEARFALAEEHWLAGAAALGPLAEWRRLSLEGSLRRDQQRFAESLARLDASLAVAPAEARGRLLVNKALTVEKMGDPDQALALLEEAEAVAGRSEDPRLPFYALANRTALLCRLGRFALADIELVRLEALAQTAGPEVQRTWLRWIRGSVAAGIGRWGRAAADLAAAARAFAGQKSAWECALVSLELAVLLCRCRQLSEAHDLARGLGWILDTPTLSRQALAAVQLLVDAAEGSRLTLPVAEQALQLLQRAPKADTAGEPQISPEAGTAGSSDLASFSPASAANTEPLPSLGARGGEDDLGRGRRSRPVAAATTGIEDAAAIQDVAGRGPQAGHPGDQAVDQTGGGGGGVAASRQRG